MASGAPTDDALDAAEEITIAVHINKENESTSNLNPSQDLWKPAELEIKPIKLSNLKSDIPTAFRNSSFKSLFKNDNYEWKIFSYDPTKAEIEISNDDDLQTEILNFNAQDKTEDDGIKLNSNKFLKLRIVFFKRNLFEEKSLVETDVKSQNIDTTQQRHTPSIIIIQKGEIISHYIEPTCIDCETITIRLSLNNHVSKTTKFVVYQVGYEAGDKLAKIQLKKNQIKAKADIDPDEIDAKSFKIAVYQKQHDTKPISNILQITRPDEEQSEDYIPIPISLSTVKAIELDDEKNENIYVYFDLPSNIQGEDIQFKVK
eukprot:59708_1